jgi:putative ABC transport system ATP-binding protein
MEKTLIKLENVWKTYQLGELKLDALRGVDLEIRKGHFVTLMGPSGSGKSTLLHIVGVLDIPSKGKVFLSGEDISKMTETELAQARGRQIGFVFQQFNLLMNLTAAENVMLPMVFQGTSEQERRKRAEKLLDSLGLKERVNHRPAELSGGERQRVAIARALANDPDIIVADEPTGNLDSSTGKEVMEIFVDLHKKEKKTIIVVTHDPNIAKHSEELVNILDGKIVKNHGSKSKVLWENGNNKKKK